MTADLFDGFLDEVPSREAIVEGAVLLRGIAKPIEHEHPLLGRQRINLTFRKAR